MIGKTVSHYKILEKLGGGGMGVVYRGEDIRLRRPVAVKFLPERLGEDAEALKRFQREAESASKLNHPHICTIYDIGEHEGHPFLVMELMEGQTIKHEIESGSLSTDRIVELGAQIVDALDAAHTARIVHRDIKPANLFVTRRGDAKVLDFGLAKMTEDEARRVSSNVHTESKTEVAPEQLTAPGTTIGTISYMSPEQVRGEELDVRTDLFSLGVVLYEMATGRQPFQGATAAVVFNEILSSSRPTPAIRHNPNLPDEFDLILRKALEKDRKLRYQSAKELLTDLRRLQRDTVRRETETGTGALAAPSARRSDSRSARAKPSLAVVPFDNLSDDPDQDYFAKGLWADINTDLVKLSGLFLISQTTTQLYATRKATPQQVALELNVRYVLQGTVRKASSQVRITAELIDTQNRKSMWGDRFDGTLDNLFALQDQITEEIVTALDIQLVHGESSRISRRSLKNPKARDAYYRALPFLLADKRDELHQAHRLFEEAARLEPESPIPPAFGAWSHFWEARLGLSESPSRSLETAAALAQKAIELDDPTGFAQMLRGTIYLMGGEHDKALEASEVALAHRPSCPWAYALKGNIYNYTGKPAEAINLAKQAISLTPLFPSLFPAVQATGHYLCDQPREAVDAARGAIELAPDSLEAQVMLVAALVAEGRADQAESGVQEIRRIRKDFSVAKFSKEQPYADPSVLERLADDLRAAGLP